ncbi:MAG: hypothetical protein M3R63_17635 [Actinomycetota bacterium]|nr:hypothetical protein [Actinomycetota bacterium]
MQSRSASSRLKAPPSAAAALVRGADGTVAAVIGLSNPYCRLNDDELRQVAPLVQDAAMRASLRIGYGHRGNGTADE